MGKIADRIYAADPWRIIDTNWTPDRNEVGESIFSLANEYMGFRDYAEEGANAPSLIGSYFGGVYEWNDEGPATYRGIVRRPHHMVCAADFLRVRISIGEDEVHLTEKAEDFHRELDLRSGLLTRQYTHVLPDGTRLRLGFARILGMDDYQCAAQRITLTADRDCEARIEVSIDGGIIHQATGKCQWTKVDALTSGHRAGVRYKTETTNQTVEYLMEVRADASMKPVMSDRLTGFAFELPLEAGVPVEVERLILNTVQPEGALNPAKLEDVLTFDAIVKKNVEHWRGYWQQSDVEIEGDILNQQGIRYCLFQLHQTYRGLDGHHNIGAKGLTGEAYAGQAFWDSETYCLPYYLYNDRQAAKALLMYRYNTLPQARERAKQLDCKGACYPIATINGSESCDLWQHASLQMQPSTAVAFAIDKYAAVTGDEAFLFHEGIEMLTEISRYVVSRGGWNQDHTGFGFWGVMGPDEFHMMVNNDYYTNFMGRKTLEITLSVLERMEDRDRWATPQERDDWREISKSMIAHKTDTGVFEQHDGFFTMPHTDIHAIPVSEFPLYEHWSYDRIYRTDMIKQPAVLMAMFLYPEDFSDDQVAVNYDYYEPRCIHESSLSPSVHAVLAQRLGRDETAAEFFSFSTRLDLDNYNRNTREGLHTTSIAAAWVTIVYGFGGLTNEGDLICLAPHLPMGWKRYTFRFLAGDGVVQAEVTEDGCKLSMVSGTSARVKLFGQCQEVRA